MKYRLSVCFILGIVLQMDAQFLDQYQWKNRLIIIYENTDQHNRKSVSQEEVLLNQKTDLEELKLRVLKYNGTVLREAYPLDQSLDFESLGITFKHDFEVILVGLDGSIKARFSDITSPDRLFSVIDSMPMRRTELRKKKKN